MLVLPDFTGQEFSLIIIITEQKIHNNSVTKIIVKYVYVFCKLNRAEEDFLIPIAIPSNVNLFSKKFHVCSADHLLASVF